MSSKIKVAFCVAYDWDLLTYSLPLVYKSADSICLALDKDRISWAGNKFEFEEDRFRHWVEQVDTEHKITILEDDFHIADLNPMQNEVRQRNLMAAYLGVNDGWHIQLDADEYFLNFDRFVHHLRKIKTKRSINICCPLITLFKQVDGGFLLIKNEATSKQEVFPIATNKPHYEMGRRNGHFNRVANFVVLHQSWARTPKEIQQKISNWGHKTDFDVNAYFEFWKNIGHHNYQAAKNIHPIVPSEWESLEFQMADDIPTLLEHSKDQTLVKFSRRHLFIKNSVWISRLKKLSRIVKQRN